MPSPIYSTAQALQVQRWILQKVQGAAAECRGADAVRTAMDVLSHFQMLMNSDAVTHQFHGASAAGAAMDPQKVQGAAAECRGAERRTYNNGCTVSNFQILMNSAAVTRLFRGAGAAGAAMDPAEGAACRCRVPRCEEPCVQRILQRVQGASAEYCRAELRPYAHGLLILIWN